jgi:capsular exopolysaccharide synthesis family protein
VFLIVGALTLLWPKTYESSATILVEKRTPTLDSQALAVLERLGRANETETEIELVRSRTVLEFAVDQLDQHVVVETGEGNKRPGELFQSFSAGRNARPGSYRLSVGEDRGYSVTDVESGRVVAEIEPGSEASFEGITLTPPPILLENDVLLYVMPFPLAVEETEDRIGVSRVHRDADLIRVRCEGRTAQSAHDLCGAISSNYMLLRGELQRAEATATAAFLREQSSQIGDQLAAAEDSLEAYARLNQVVALEERAGEEVRQYAELRAQREQLAAERSALAVLITDIEREEPGARKYRELASFPTFLQNEAVTELLAGLIELENSRSELALRRSERNPDLVALDSRITEIERQLQSIATSYEKALTAQIASLDKSLSGAGQRLATIPTQQVQIARLERHANLLEDLYAFLETRLREAEVAEAVNLPSARVVDVASFPQRPTSPNTPVNLTLGLLFGLACGLTLAFYREFRDTRFRDRLEVERETGLPVLTMIPRLREPGPVLPIASLKTGKPIVDKDPRSSSRVSDQRLMALESFRSLAADLSFAARSIERDSLSSVAITSASRGEGKTFTACNLALVSAARGSRTLLIDADMRASGVTRFFNLPSTMPGLSDVLAGSAVLQNVWRRIRIRGSELWVIPGGTATPHSAWLLESPEFAAMLAGAALDFDQVIIDTPPLNVITDAATIASSVDAVVLVVRGGVTDRDSLELTLERLDRASGPVVGILLNDVELPEQYLSHYDYGRTQHP